MSGSEIKIAYGLRHEPMRYRALRLALNAAYVHATKPMCVVLGDDGRYWVVCPADASRLERAGLEYA